MSASTRDPLTKKWCVKYTFPEVSMDGSPQRGEKIFSGICHSPFSFVDLQTA